MSIFEVIFEKILKIENTNIQMKKHISKIFLFTQYFTKPLFNLRTNYSWKKYIEYKYFILKNYLKVGNNFVDDNYKETVLRFFSETQKHIMALYRFKEICLDKTKKYLDEPQDLQFNLLSETPTKHKLDIIHSGIKYQFSIFDLIRIINTSLSYEYNFFTDPKKVKNPWNNNPFSVATLYNIYFFISKTNIKMPILFERFFQTNFSLDMFEKHNQLVIKNYTFTFTPYSITVLFTVMNIPIIFGGLYELSVIECKPYSHFFILCDSFTTFISTVNIPIEKYL